MVAATGSEAAVDGSMPEVSTGAPSNWLLCTRATLYANASARSRPGPCHPPSMVSVNSSAQR